MFSIFLDQINLRCYEFKGYIAIEFHTSIKIYIHIRRYPCAFCVLICRCVSALGSMFSLLKMNFLKQHRILLFIRKYQNSSNNLWSLHVGMCRTICLLNTIENRSLQSSLVVWILIFGGKTPYLARLSFVFRILINVFPNRVIELYTFQNPTDYLLLRFLWTTRMLIFVPGRGESTVNFLSLRRTVC
jgi:hypothetical protein